MSYSKPLPLITETNAPYWSAAKANELRLPRCIHCRSWVYPIAPFCQSCWSEEYVWDLLSGKGRVSSWVVFHRAFDKAFESDIPYIVAEIELEEGIRMISSVLGATVKSMFAGMPVFSIFEHVTKDVTLIKFRRG